MGVLSFRRLQLAAAVSLVVWLWPSMLWAQQSPGTIYELLNQDPNACHFSRQHLYDPYGGSEEGGRGRY